MLAFRYRTYQNIPGQKERLMEEGFCSLGSSHPGAFCLERRSEEKGTQRTWAVCLLNTLVYPTPHPRLQMIHESIC